MLTLLLVDTRSQTNKVGASVYILVLSSAPLSPNMVVTTSSGAPRKKSLRLYRRLATTASLRQLTKYCSTTRNH
ncbi:hypothetical protein F2P81_000566 [Scophthalmus maximus]|uniref:Uncharacterized protein n=1 Tax=Scophthalmus maximus TaxID=52904 RepID=A0A6A4TLF0_SCOMX|nr:hypothetical protein F2P81_000566 [Scophthalmus maximus]